jgi:Uma2 family endonuclease
MKTALTPGHDDWRRMENDPVLQRLQPKGLPILFGDENTEMGESILHTLTCGILFYGLQLHFGNRKNLHVFANLNLYYSDGDPPLYVSPDLMLVQSARRFPLEMSSYRIGKDGPAPCLAAEVLSFRTYHEGDLSSKPILYADLGVEEYILADVTGKMLPQKLLLLRRQVDGTWLDEQDADGGLTSRWGFRLVLDADKQLRVVDAATGAAYSRPNEGAAQLQDMTAAYRKEADTRKQLEAEVERLRRELAKHRQAGNGDKGRRHKP